MGKQRAHRRVEHEKKLASMPPPTPAPIAFVQAVPPPVVYSVKPKVHPQLVGEPQLYEGVIFNHKQFEYAFLKGDKVNAFMVATKIPRLQRYLMRKGTRVRCMVRAQEGRDEMFVVEVLEMVPRAQPQPQAAE